MVRMGDGPQEALAEVLCHTPQHMCPKVFQDPVGDQHCREEDPDICKTNLILGKNKTFSRGLTTMRRACRLFDLRSAPVPFDRALRWQQHLLKEGMAAAREERPTRDALLLLEHPAVFTLGRGATEENIKFDQAEVVEQVVRIERGGEVTWHGPGQLVGYPVIDL